MRRCITTILATDIRANSTSETQAQCLQLPFLSPWRRIENCITKRGRTGLDQVSGHINLTFQAYGVLHIHGSSSIIARSIPLQIDLKCPNIIFE